MDSFDHYSDPGLKWYDSHNATIIRNAGRFGTDACQLESDGYLTYYQPDLDVAFNTSYMNCQEWIVGFAYKRTISETSSLVDFCLYPNSGVQISLGVNSSGTLYFTSGSLLVLTTALAIVNNAWYYLEAHVRNDVWPAEVYEIHVNGNVWGSGVSPITFVPTPFYSDPPAEYINSIVINGSGTPYIDDVYILALNANDPQGTGHNNTFWGDTRIEASQPSSDGFYQDWTPSSGSFGYLMVNDPYAQFTDNVYAYPAYQRETFGMTYNIALPGSVNAVQHSYLSRQVNYSESIIYTGGSVYYPVSVSNDSRVSFPSNTAAEYLSTIWQVDPSSGSGWDSVNLPAAEFGFMSNTTSGSL